MHARRFWQSMLSVTAATILIGQQILAKTVIAEAQDNLNGIPILSPPYPPVTAATWEGYTETNFESVFPDGVTACESFKTLLTSPLTSPTLEETKLEYFQEGGKEGEVYQNLCYLKALNINDGQYYYYDYASRVSCPIIALPERYIYIGDIFGVCVLPSMLEGTGPIEGAIGVWESTLPDNAYQMAVLWNPQTNRYEGYLIQQGVGSEGVGFKVGELVWTGTPTSTGTLTENQKWRWMQEGISYEEWRNGSASLNPDQDILVSTAVGANLLKVHSPDTNLIQDNNSNDILIGNDGNDKLVAGRWGNLFKQRKNTNPKISDHAQQRAKEGRPTALALQDVQKARKADVFIQPNGNYVVRGSQGREHIYNSNGQLVTSISNRPQNAHLNKVKNGERTPVTEAQYNKFIQKLKVLWKF